KPAIDRNDMASAASEAENDVVAPICLARSSILASSPPVAPEMAETLFIDASKPPDILSAVAPAPARGRVRDLVMLCRMACILPPADCNEVDKPCDRDWPDSWPALVAADWAA